MVSNDIPAPLFFLLTIVQNHVTCTEHFFMGFVFASML
jgi:hypothetical protein